MVTKELTFEKSCVFCASEYHLEMILLPYIAEKMENSKFVIITQNSLEDSVKIVLDRVNLKENVKEKILKLDWKSNKNLEKIFKSNEKIIAIINGNTEYIKSINEEIKSFAKKDIEIIDCFHVGDRDVDINELKSSYKNILNTKRI